MIKGIHLMRIGGVEIRLDWSLLIIVALVTISLGNGVLARWHPEWSALTIWTTAVAAAILLLVSVLLHELAHALVGRRHGIEIKRITLFVFGGMSHLEGEPHAWRAELWMAIVGPIVSLLIGGICIGIASAALAGEGALAAEPLAAIRELGPGATLMLWLGPVNMVLALFNVVPAFPLDGGRVVRAIIWGATGNFARATRLASVLGQAFGWALIAAGVAMMLGLTVPIFGTGLVGGLWISLIGWFLHNAAIMSYRQAQLGEALAGVRVGEIMKTEFATVPADLPVQTLVDDYLMSREQRCYPVVDGRELSGIVCLDDLRHMRRADWPAARTREIMTPADRLVTMSPGTPANEALTALTNRRVNQLPIVDHGEIKGLLSREDILKWLAFFGPAPAIGRRYERTAGPST